MPTTTGRLEELRSLEPYEFEHFVANVWSDRGWQTHVLPETNDYGIDVIATKSDPTPQKLLIQAKRNAADNTVGAPDIQQYRSLLEQEPDADSVIIVTTSSFTSQAREIAERMNVKLVDGDGLLRIIEDGSLPSTQPTPTHGSDGDSGASAWQVLVRILQDPERVQDAMVSLFVIVMFGYVFWKLLEILIL